MDIFCGGMNYNFPFNKFHFSALIHFRIKLLSFFLFFHSTIHLVPKYNLAFVADAQFYK